jgi:glycosidase
LLPHLQKLGINALYLGPLFESVAHGYDTLDYYHVDRRLGNNGDLKRLVRVLHENGIRVILDGVFNHSVRHFYAFKDLQAKGPDSEFTDWYSGIDFGKSSPAGDAFTYETWNGCYDLVKFNGKNRAVREHLFGAAAFWIEEFGIDGLRLDAADQLLPDFMEELSARCKALKPGFWLMGEVVHGDYRRWARPGCLDSVTNYELYKGLWSSFNDRNFFELAWTLNRQFGPDGMYRNLGLYNFADNHDVNRTAGLLKTKAHIFPLYGLLFAVPGIPSIYYGSEYGVRGERKNGSDDELRPAWDLLTEQGPADRIPPEYKPAVDGKALFGTIGDFAAIRKRAPALMYGSYRQIHVSSEQFVFIREYPEAENSGKSEKVLVAVNSSERERRIMLDHGALGSGGNYWRDILSGETFSPSGGKLSLPLHPSWLRILEPEYKA